MTNLDWCDRGNHFCNVGGCQCPCHTAEPFEPPRSRVRFVDTDPRPRGLDALIPTAVATPAPDVRMLQWKQLEAALFSLTNAQFEYERGEHENGRTHVEDCRRAIGALALTLADGPDAEGYARLFDAIMTEPKVQR